MNRFTRAIRARLERDAHLAAERMDLLTWSKHFLPDHTERPWSLLHRWLANELDQASRARGRKINLVGPRGAAKSTLATLCYILKRICEADEPYIWLISDTKGQAQTHLENVRHELQTNRTIQLAYGAHNLTRAGQWTEERLQLANGTTIEAYGTGQRLRGRRRGAKRPTLIVCDDIQNDSHAISRGLRQKTREWFNGTLLKAGRAHTNIINVGTALHREATAMELTQTPGWRSRVFPSIIDWPTKMELWDHWEQIYNQPEDPHATENADKYFDANRTAMLAGAQVLWPAEESLYQLMKMRVESGRTAFEREKQSVPTDPERQEFDESMFGDWIWYDELPSEIYMSAMVLDASKGRKDRLGDYSAWIYAALTTNGIIYVDAELARENATNSVARGVNIYQRLRPDIVGVETNAFQELLVGEFERQFAAAKLFHIVIDEIDNTIPKIVRIRRLGPYLSQKRLRFRRNSPWTRELVNQLRDFPTGAHDDAPDALEMTIRIIGEKLGNAIINVGRMKLQTQ